MVYFIMGELVYVCLFYIIWFSLNAQHLQKKIKKSNTWADKGGRFIPRVLSVIIKYSERNYFLPLITVLAKRHFN